MNTPTSHPEDAQTGQPDELSPIETVVFSFHGNEKSEVGEL